MFFYPCFNVLWVLLSISLLDSINLWTSGPIKTSKQAGGGGGKGGYDKFMVRFENFIVSKKKPFKFTIMTIPVHCAWWTQSSFYSLSLFLRNLERDETNLKLKWWLWLALLKRMGMQMQQIFAEWPAVLLPQTLWPAVLLPQKLTDSNSRNSEQNISARLKLGIAPY